MMSMHTIGALLVCVSSLGHAAHVTSHDPLCHAGLSLPYLSVHLVSCSGNRIWRDNGGGDRQFDW